MIRRRRLYAFFLLTAATAVFTVTASAQRYNESSLYAIKPRLVVNIAVSGMRYDQIAKYAENYSKEGFMRMAEQGVVYTQSRYDFMQTEPVVTLATLGTGANPSVHGVVGTSWIDYVTMREVGLIDDPAAQGLDNELDNNNYSNRNLTIPTIGDQLRSDSPDSKVVSIALEAESAIVMGGMNSDVFWLDMNSGEWTSSSKYMLYMPGWAINYNHDNARSITDNYLYWRWNASQKGTGKFKNSRYSVIGIEPESHMTKVNSDYLSFGRSVKFREVLYTPAGNDMLIEFVKQAIVNEKLGQGSKTDMLNICFDAPGYIMKAYGPESVEVEDMLYRLDRTVGSLLNFLIEQFGETNVLVVFTSTNGMSDSYDAVIPNRERFNPDQFAAIMNSFLIAQYGGDQSWVMKYENRRLYLNRTQAYNLGLDVSEVQSRAATFALQFRGVSHVVTATTMQNGGFSDSYMRKIQNSFYPKRSGDIAINLMAGWINDEPMTRSQSGSLYDYDTHVPLIFFGCGLQHRVISRSVDMTSVAPTLAHILDINRPIASTAEPLEEVVELFGK